MKGGAVALDGQIDPGDMILQVNDISFDNMTNDDAVRVLKEVVQKPGPIKLVVAKSWPDSGHSTAKGYLTMPRTMEPVRPIDPGAWVAHTAAVRGNQLFVYFFMCHCLFTFEKVTYVLGCVKNLESFDTSSMQCIGTSE